MQKLGSLHLVYSGVSVDGAFALYLFSMSAYSVSKAALTTDYSTLKSEREQQQQLFYENVLYISSIY